ncbi:FAD-binding oxidoreductase [Actinokineospora cianjurensis]|uniref:FAD/FMN-containing dehydrogenase n=1 Tax=Actinokineospora cianjurensis TaxID=585224 RepID=A0A421AYN7_9PSEU|nr:FAD-binding oxidoreductase [Actinokineospora cianjurensis]RLK54983.1 FAD/FMN-containing dehydrogenase [Actinokineospora cianjurensis]
MNTSSVAGTPALREAAFDLDSRLRGDVLLPDTPGYAEAIAAHNQTAPHRVAVAVVAADAGDVRDAVAFAAAHALPVAVQATGHGPSTTADDGLLIVTRGLDGVTIDAAARTARVEAGARWGKVVAAAAKEGLAPPNGSSPLVGAIGYAIGGGVGPLGRANGYAADHVRSFDVVTADGVALTASATSEPDLFWALRGGKGNFGVITAMEIGLFPVTRLYGGGLFFEGDNAAEILRTYRDWTTTTPEELASSIAFIRFPDLDVFPEPLRGKYIAHIRVFYFGSAEDGERLVTPLRAIGTRLIDTLADLPYTEIGTINNDPTEPGPYYERSTLLRSLDDAALDTLIDLIGPDANSPLLAVEVRQLGGAFTREPATPNAISFRDAAFSLFLASVPTPDKVTEAVDYQTTVLSTMSPWTTGGPYLCFIGSHETDEATVRAAYEPAVYQRLREVKRQYDPTNLFRVNHNIPPA